MRFLKASLAITSALVSALCLMAQAPAPVVVPGKEARIVQGIPPRVSADEYMAKATVGKIVIGAEFTGHGVATPDTTYTTEEYVVVEVGMFGPQGSRIVLAPEDFSLRINGAKATRPSVPYGLAAKSMKDPDWEAEAATLLKKAKEGSGGGNGINAGGGGGAGAGDPPPVAPKMPLERRRAMELKVQKASLPEGDRALPLAGLLYFQFSGKTKNMKSLELVYTGPAGKTTIPLQP